MVTPRGGVRHCGTDNNAIVGEGVYRAEPHGEEEVEVEEEEEEGEEEWKNLHEPRGESQMHILMDGNVGVPYRKTTTKNTKKRSKTE